MLIGGLKSDKISATKWSKSFQKVSIQPTTSSWLIIDSSASRQVWSSCIIRRWNKTLPRSTFSRIFLREIYRKHISWVSKYLLCRFWAKLDASKAKSKEKFAKQTIRLWWKYICHFPILGLAGNWISCSASQKYGWVVLCSCVEHIQRVFGGWLLGSLVWIF